jgi:rRNA maturation endonuclease Nob1
MLGFDHQHPDAPALPTTKKCPDCAETILADAKVCKHCGYRFTATTSAAAAPKPAAPKTISAKAAREAAPVKATPMTTAKVRCRKCQQVQAVPQDLSLFVCEECGARLKRRTVEAEGH